MTILAANGENTELVMILVFAALLGLIPASIASNKGHSFAAWWLFGAALFIVALPVALLVKPDLTAVEESKLREGMKKCPFCVELVKKEAKVCKHCGRDLPAVEASLPVANIKCPYCGKDTASNVQICSHCSMRIAQFT